MGSVADTVAEGQEPIEATGASAAEATAGAEDDKAVPASQPADPVSDPQAETPPASCVCPQITDGVAPQVAAPPPTPEANFRRSTLRDIVTIRFGKG